MAIRKTTRALSRKGVHRLECVCGAAVFGTVAGLEKYGLPSCACGQRFVPTHLALALLLGVACPAVTEFETAKALGMDDRDAAKWVEARRLEASRARRLSLFT